MQYNTQQYATPAADATTSQAPSTMDENAYAQMTAEQQQQYLQQWQEWEQWQQYYAQQGYYDPSAVQHYDPAAVQQYGQQDPAQQQYHAHQQYYADYHSQQPGYNMYSQQAYAHAYGAVAPDASAMQAVAPAAYPAVAAYAVPSHGASVAAAHQLQPQTAVALDLAQPSSSRKGAIPEWLRAEMAKRLAASGAGGDNTEEMDEGGAADATQVRKSQNGKAAGKGRVGACRWMCEA